MSTPTAITGTDLMALRGTPDFEAAAHDLGLSVRNGATLVVHSAGRDLLADLLGSGWTGVLAPDRHPFDVIAVHSAGEWHVFDLDGRVRLVGDGDALLESLWSRWSA